MDVHELDRALRQLTPAELTWLASMELSNEPNLKGSRKRRRYMAEQYRKIAVTRILSRRNLTVVRFGDLR